ncbi:MAG TPA: PAS domain-containing sensor histidine kinase [Alphaproteobacteria bacterium]|nr:PAS domain-containing sensor histidine kinase [Alphaproteobacteria bacterium]
MRRSVGPGIKGAGHEVTRRMTANEIDHGPSTLKGRWTGWFARSGLGRLLAIALAVCAALSGLATYAALTKALPVEVSPNLILVFLYCDLILLLLLVVVVAHRITMVWMERRRGSAGSRLHVRLVVLFSLVTVTPTIVIAVFSSLFLNFGLQSWFSDKVRTAIQESVAVANAYLDENVRTIKADAVALSQHMQSEVPLLVSGDPDNIAEFQQILNSAVDQLSLTEAVVFDDSFHVLARARLSFAMEREGIPGQAIEKAQRGDVALLRSEADDRVRALLRMEPPSGEVMPRLYLFVGRFVEPAVLQHVERAQAALTDYHQLELARSDIEITFALIFGVVALLLLLAAVWLGLYFATQLVRPISALIAAAERVRAGDLTARVLEAGAKGDEISSLSRAFNRMTGQLEEQRRELIEANRQLDARRRFTEAVLSGVSAGVIGLDQHGRVNLPNRSACELLSTSPEQLIGRLLDEAIPEVQPLLREARRRPRHLVEAELKIARGGRARTLLVRIAAERVNRETKGFVVTFDDISELLAAQRTAAWGDVARRIAHEIKNPLTPIQLSAERLKRKYLREIMSDPETFLACTETIVRQAGDIGRMVDEFSAFARMPAPVMKEENLVELCRQAIFLQRQGNPDIVYDAMLPAEALRFRCDARQIGQAITNLLKNAAESIQATRTAAEDGPPRQGCISLRLEAGDGQIEIQVEDNGKGFPVENRERLTEPYVTTREKGTGLGLAIVRKIMEDHRGDLLLEDRQGGGARAILRFKLPDAAQSEDEEENGKGTSMSSTVAPASAHGS